MNAAPVPISGMGIICAIGNDRAQVLDSLLQGRSGIAPIKYLKTVHTDIPVGEVKLSNDQMRLMLSPGTSKKYSRTSMMGAIAVKEALASAGIKFLEGKRIVLVSGTTVGNMDINEDGGPSVGNDCGQSTEDIALLSGLEGARCCTVCTACSAALNAMMTGCEMLRNGEADIVIAGGTEALSRYHLNGFNTLMICDRERCRPFDATRNGLNLGEGAAFVVLERSSTNPIAYINGYGNHCDAYHQTASSPDGEGAFLAMSDALTMAGLAPGEINYVNAHGTGTPNNDLSESRALMRIFGPSLPEISSTKAFTGHTTSASGSIETVMCILAMQNDFTLPNLGWETPMDGGITPTSGTKGITLDHIMCNAFGFGGNDSSLILSSPRSVTADCKTEGRMSEQGKIAVSESVVISDDEQLSELKKYISPLESRRMCKIMKASLLSAIIAMEKDSVQCPDAIITATAKGMYSLSQIFLNDIRENGEELLKPTVFMQSTHNTIGSLIAIRCKCHGYNITYSQGQESEQWALMDARGRLSRADSSCVLVVVFDEDASGDFYAKSTILRKNLFTV